MKTICFIVPLFPSVSQTFVTSQIIDAKQQGYSVCVLTYKLGRLEESSQGDLIEKHGLLENTVVIDYKIPKSKLKRLFVGLFYILKYFKYWIQGSGISMRHRILNWPYLINFYVGFRYIDVFHIQFALGGTSIAEMKMNGLLKAKIITTFHGSDAHFKNEKVLKKLQNTYRTLFEMANYVTVNTPYLENQVLTLGCKKEALFIIPMAIDVDYFKSAVIKELPDGTKQVKLISIGRLIEFKGFEFAIKAVKLLVDQGVPVQYTIVGEGPLFQSLLDQIKTLKIEAHASLVGNKSQNDIRDLLDSHNVYLMSSVTDSKGRCETQGVVTAEAQAMGLPVVAFNNGGIPYTIQDGETGLLVQEKDVNAYAEAILELMSSPVNYQKMSIQARQFAVANFSNTLMTERFMALYEQ